MATIPSTNVNLATNVRDILNAAGGSVNNNLITFFQTGAKLNRWSKYKPVQSSFVGAPPFASWYEGDNHKCGLDYPSYSSAAQLRANYSGVADWKYVLPTSPLRLHDFRGYNTDAKYQISKIECPVRIITGGNIQVNITLKTQASSELKISEIGGGKYNGGYFGDYYFGIYGKSAYSERFVTSTTKIRDLSGIETLSMPTVRNSNTYDLYTFICSEGSLDTAYPDNLTMGIEIIPMHGFAPFEVEPKQEYVITIGASWDNNHSVSYEIYIQNFTSNATTFTSPMVGARYKDWGTSLSNGETVENITAITVPANSNITRKGTLNAEKLEYSDNWYFWFVDNNKSIKLKDVIV